MTGRFILIFFLTSFLVQAQQYELNLQRDRLLMGQSTQLELIWHGPEPIEVPEIPDQPGLSFQFAGQSFNSFFSFGSNRGNNHQVSTSYRWDIIPKEVGKWQVPSITLSDGNLRIETEPISVVVEEPGSMEGYYFELSSDQDMLLPGLQSIVSLRFLFRDRVHNLRYSIPFLESNPQQFAAVIPSAAQSDIRRTVLYGREYFGEVGSEYRDGVQYTSFTLRFIYTPQNAGKVDWPGAYISFDVEELGRSFRLVEHSIQSNPLSIVVEALPDEVRNNSQGVLISEGVLQAHRSLEPDILRVGDPTTLVIRYENLMASDIIHHADPEEYMPILKDFTFSEEEIEIVQLNESTLEIRKKIRLVSGDSNEIPSLELAYFNMVNRSVEYLSLPSLDYEIHGQADGGNQIEELGQAIERQEALSSRRAPETLAIHYPWNAVIAAPKKGQIHFWLVMAVSLLGPIVFCLIVLRDRQNKNRKSRGYEYPWRNPQCDPIEEFKFWFDNQDGGDEEKATKQIAKWERAFYTQAINRDELLQEMELYVQNMG